MSQYFMFTAFDGKPGKNPAPINHQTTWPYKSGAKLLEFSWQTNNFMRVVEWSLMEGNPNYMKNIAFIGDESITATKYGWDSFSKCMELSSIAPDPTINNILDCRLIVNHTKKLYVDKQTIPSSHQNFFIHPLPLLTCVGAYMDDYNGYDQYMVGKWAYDSISMEHQVPDEYEYKQLFVKFKA